MNPISHNKMITENVTKVYKMTDDNLVEALNAQSVRLAKQHKLDACIEKLAKREAKNSKIKSTICKTALHVANKYIQV